MKAVGEVEVRHHDYAPAITSSQMFALNLFIPWRRGARRGLEARLAVLGESIVVERVAFPSVDTQGIAPRPPPAGVSPRVCRRSRPPALGCPPTQSETGGVASASAEPVIIAMAGFESSSPATIDVEPVITSVAGFVPP